MAKSPVVRSIASLAAAAVLVGGIAACDRDDASQASGPTPSVVTVTATAPTSESSTSVVPTESAEASSVGARPMDSGEPSDGTPTSAVSDYYGEWTGHSRRMTLNPDGSATAFVGAGAADSETWTAKWTRSGDGIGVTLLTMTKRFGSPLELHSGTSWTGALQRSPEDGVTILHMPDFADWCSVRFGYSMSCGA